MILPSIPHLIKYIETFPERGEEDMISVTMSLADLRILARGQLTDDSPPSYTSRDVNRR